MNRFTSYPALFACMCLLTAPACRNRPGNGGNGNDQVPADVQKAIDDVVIQLEATSQAVGGAIEGFASVDLDDDDTFGDCPEVVFVRQDNVSTLGLTYESGCESDYYEDLAVSGSISIVFDRNASAFDADFEAFTVDGQTTNGDLHVSRSEAGDLRTWSGTIDISTTGVGSTVGDIVLEINVLTSTITIGAASLNLAGADGETYSAEVEGLVIRPVANDSFIPEAGTVTFEAPNDDPEGPDTITVVIEFDSNSPFDGTIKLTVGDNVFGNYPLGAL